MRVGGDRIYDEFMYIFQVCFIIIISTMLSDIN